LLPEKHLKKTLVHTIPVLVSALIGMVFASPIASQTPGDFDVAQAEAMANLIESVASGEARPGLIDTVMAYDGTALIVGQLNLARSVSSDQYRQMLEAFVEGRRPVIEPLDDGVRAQRGVDGLTDAWERLNWARDNVDLVRQRIREVAAMRIKREARQTAMELLPEPVRLSPALYVVAGGRAGAAAIGDSSIYFDIVVMSRAAQRRPQARAFDQHLIRGFVAHEFHHLAVGRLHRRLGLRELDESDRWALGMLGALVEEGSATYFIDWDGDLESHRQDPDFARYLGDLPSWYAAVERMLTEITTGLVASEESFEELTSVMLGNSYHAVGASMFAAIDRTLGRDAALDVVGDPRLLLRTFNEASASYRFSESLAVAVADIGSAP
jgi:hypothetical protein